MMRNDEFCVGKKRNIGHESVSHRYNLKASPQALQCHITKAHLCHRSQGWVGPFRHLRARSQQLPRCGEWIVTVSSRCSFYPNSFAKVPRGAHDSWWPARPKLTTLWFDLNINHHQPIGKPPTNIPLKKEKQKGTKKINTKSSMMPLRPEAWDLINLSPLRCSKSPLLLWGRAVPRETHSLRLESSLSEAFPGGSIPNRKEEQTNATCKSLAIWWYVNDVWWSCLSIFRALTKDKFHDIRANLMDLDCAMPQKLAAFCALTPDIPMVHPSLSVA